MSRSRCWATVVSACMLAAAVAVLGAAAPWPLAAQHHGGELLGWTVQGTAFVQIIRTSGDRETYQLGSINRVMIQSTTLAGGGVLRWHFMGSAEPVTIGRGGYPEPLQVSYSYPNHLVTDHAHPDHWVMELAASYERPLASGIGWSVYVAPVGDPALGPVPYQHRSSALFDPLAPLGHHDQDEAHGSFGVVTLGAFSHRVRVEGSAFNDRQPTDPVTVFDYHGARLDAFAGRISVSPAVGWSVSASYGYLPASGGGPARDAQHRTTASVQYTHASQVGAEWSVTAVYGVNRPLGAPALPTALIEAVYGWHEGEYAVHGRIEQVRRSDAELALVGSLSPSVDLRAATAGITRRIMGWEKTEVRLDAQATTDRLPSSLEPFYGSRRVWTGVVGIQINR